jgi:predicted RNA-binding Zn-ribbon protein involved in translation (DUF1610 family)
MRKVFLDDLPRWGCKNKLINWKASIGCIVKFIYDEIEGEVQILDYCKENKKIKIKYNDSFLEINRDSFMNGKLGVLLGKINKKHSYIIGQIVKTKTGKIQILEQIRLPIGDYTKRGYRYKCLIDNNIDIINEYDLMRGSGCNVCSGRKIIRGYNDLWTTSPEISKLLKFPECGYILTSGTEKCAIFICPDCGYEKIFRVCNIINQGFSCPRCGDGVSYPNKFVRSFFDQINEIYIPEYSPNWANNKVYDNFLPNQNELWEIHGVQHYKKGSGVYSKKKSLKEQQENDRVKKDLAKKNGCKYIEIDARKSELEWIKNSIINLPEIKRYDLDNIDWNVCNKYACNNLVKIVNDLWNDGCKNIFEISKLVKLSKPTIINYLKRGALLSWSDYNPREEIKKSWKKRSEKTKSKNQRKVVQMSIEGIFIKEWDSMREASRELNVRSCNIWSCCNGRRNHAGKYKWLYIEDYMAQTESKNNNPEKKEVLV